MKIHEIEISYNLSEDIVMVSNVETKDFAIASQFLVPQIGSRLKMQGKLWHIAMVKYDHDNHAIDVYSDIYMAMVEKKRAEQGLQTASC